MKSLFAFIMLYAVLPFGQDIAMTTAGSGAEFEINDPADINQSSVRLPDTPTKFAKSTSPFLMDMCFDKIIIEFPMSTGISGPNTCDGISNGIGVLAYAEGLSCETSVGPGTPISAAPAVLQSVNFTRFTDVYSAEFRSLLITGTTIPYIEISFVKSIMDGTKRQYVLNRYEGCLINSAQSGASGGEENPTENFSFSFTKACYRTFERSFSTGAIISQNDACVDLTLTDQAGCACGTF